MFVDQNTLDLTSIVGNSDGVGVLHQHVFLPSVDPMIVSHLISVVRMTMSDEVALGTGETQAGALTRGRRI